MAATKKESSQIQKIQEKVDRKEQSFEKRTAVMDAEYDWGWKNTAFVPDPMEGIQQKDVVTTNFPKITARKVSNGVGYAEKIIRVEDDADNLKFRDANNAYERLAVGMLGNADKRLQHGGMNATIQGELAWYAVVRGAWIAARAVLIKGEDGETIEDVEPIDPRNLVYEPGKGGPIWAAIVTERSRDKIRDEYPKFKFSGEDNEHGDDDSDQMSRVVDYYYSERDKKGKKRFMNCVIVDNQYARKPTDTFSINFPIPIRLIGNNPGVMNYSLKESREGSRDIAGIEDVGDSIFAALRHTTPQVNRLASMRMGLTAKAYQGTMIISSRDGTKELDQDGFKSGTELGMSTDNNEKIELLPVSQLTADTAQLEGELRLYESNAGLSEPALGRTGTPVSGAALQILSQADNEVVSPYLKAVESLLEGIIDNLGKQYETGRYKTIHVRGKTHTDQPFNRDISPDDIKGHNVLSLELRQTQPQDDFALWQAAQVASQVDPASGQALVSKEYAATKIARVQDYDLEKRRMAGQKARMSSEKMVLLTQWEAAKLSGDEAAMEFLETDIQRILETEEMEDMARQFAFKQSMEQAPLPTAAGGVEGISGGPGPSQGGVPGIGGGQPPPNNATVSADPRLLAQSGTPGVSVEPSPDAGYNTTAPRNTAEAAGLESNI